MIKFFISNDKYTYLSYLKAIKRNIVCHSPYYVRKFKSCFSYGIYGQLEQYLDVLTQFRTSADVSYKWFRPLALLFICVYDCGVSNVCTYIVHIRWNTKSSIIHHWSPRWRRPRRTVKLTFHLLWDVNKSASHYTHYTGKISRVINNHAPYVRERDWEQQLLDMFDFAPDNRVVGRKTKVCVLWAHGRRSDSGFSEAVDRLNAVLHSEISIVPTAFRLQFCVILYGYLTT